MEEKDKKTKEERNTERYIKDTKDGDLENRSVSASKKGPLVHSDDDSPLGFFKKDRTFTFVYKKTQKLVSAIYLLTGFFSEHEPLRRELRESATESLRDALALATSAGGYDEASGERFRKTALHIISLMETGYFAGLVSEMNYDVLRREFMVVLNSLSSAERGGGARGASFFGNHFFAVDVPDEVASDAPAATGDRNTRERVSHDGTPASPDVPIKDRKPREDVPEKSSVEPSKYPSHQSGVPADDDVRRAQITPREKPRGRLSKPDEKKNERRSVIVDVVRRRGEVSIKDVAQAVTGCSEKTVQRELAALVKKGVLKKEGERRWSRYSLV